MVSRAGGACSTARWTSADACIDSSCRLINVPSPALRISAGARGVEATPPLALGVLELDEHAHTANSKAAFEIIMSTVVRDPCDSRPRV
jgi:hypothetical protein